MIDKIQELKDKRAAVLAEAKAINAAPSGQNGDCSPAQKAEIDGFCDQAGALSTEIDRLEAEDRVRMRRAVGLATCDPPEDRLSSMLREQARPRRQVPAEVGVVYTAPGAGTPLDTSLARWDGAGSGTPTEWWSNGKGERFPVFGPGVSMAAYYRAQSSDLPPVGPHPVGRTIRAMLTRDFSQVRDVIELQAAMGEGTNWDGGYLVPSQLSAQIIDLARNRSVLMRAGARTVPMTSDWMNIARISTDVTFESKTESVAFVGSQFVIGSVGIAAHTIGTVVDLSRELAADAPNITGLIESQLALSLGTEIDRLGLVGSDTGEAEPEGLVAWNDTQEILAVGSPDHGDLLDAIEIVEDDNHLPNAYVLSANTKKSLAKLLINAEANHYAPAPPDVAALNRFVTETMGDDLAVVGDFRQFIVGLRQDILIELTTEAGNRFDRHQVGVKATWRGGFNAEHQNAFCVLRGIT